MMAHYATENTLTIDYDEDAIVTVGARGVPDAQFDELLGRAHAILRRFKRSRSGSTWGTDGVGYAVNRCFHLVEVHSSGVGPRKFQQGIAQLKSEGII